MNNIARQRTESSLATGSSALGPIARTTARAAILACLCLGLAACGSDGETTDSIDEGGTSSGPPTNPAVHGQLQFSASSMNISEGAGTATFTITRTAGSDGAVSVRVSSRDGTASSDDYTPLNTTVTFADGDSAPKTVTLQITNDALVEADETLYLTLSAPTGGAGLGSANEILVTILDDDALPAEPRTALSAGNYQLHMEWSAVPGATSYRLLKAPSETAEFAQVGEDLPASARTVDFDVSAAHLDDWLNVRYAIAACNEVGCTPSAPQSARDYTAAVIDYLKAPTAKSNDRFGETVALSADGNVLVVGAPNESSAATGINGNPVADCDSATPVNCALNSGAVYIYTRTASGWSAATYLKPTGDANLNTQALFGSAVALSNDGNTLVVGAQGERTHASGVGAVRSSDCTAGPGPTCAPYSGALFVYTRTGGTWSAPTFIKGPANFQYSYFGGVLALSGDGSTLLVGQPLESSATGGAHTGPTFPTAYDCGVTPQVNCLGNSGAAFVYSRAASWNLTVFIKAPVPVAYSSFGSSVALSDDGTVAAIGADAENADDAGTTIYQAGAAYVYSNTSGGWSVDRFTTPTLADATSFGTAVSLSADGRTFAVGAPYDDTAASGVNGNQTSDCYAASESNCALDSGAVYVYTGSAGAWSTPTYIKAAYPKLNNTFGDALMLSKDGKTLVVAASNEDGPAAGIYGWNDPAVQGNGLSRSGAAYVLVLGEQGWTPRSYVKASNPQWNAGFGASLAINADGTLLAVGAPYESGAAAGLNGNQANDCNSAATPGGCQSFSGAVYLY